jgi:hypothetical protein
VAAQNNLPKHRKCERFATTPWTKNEVVTSTVAQEGLNDEGLVNESGSWGEEVSERASTRAYRLLDYNCKAVVASTEHTAMGVIGHEGMRGYLPPFAWALPIGSVPAVPSRSEIEHVFRTQIMSESKTSGNETTLPIALGSNFTSKLSQPVSSGCA